MGKTFFENTNNFSRSITAYVRKSSQEFALIEADGLGEENIKVSDPRTTCTVSNKIEDLECKVKVVIEIVLSIDEEKIGGEK